jgi:hypothetical protein
LHWHTIDIVSGVDDVAPKSAGESISKVMGFGGAIRGLTYNISLLARFHDRKINLNTYEAIASCWPPTLWLSCTGTDVECAEWLGAGCAMDLKTNTYRLHIWVIMTYPAPDKLSEGCRSVSDSPAKNASSDANISSYSSTIADDMKS